ncbi:early nodulin-like protein 14 [Vitis vinifera]|nr:early nodulin-like protein 14 [Vitis vinifera]|eukprot:XP_002265483.1 PREDICTED: early nodulin-like protein 1 [Vitis vinifera]
MDTSSMLVVFFTSFLTLLFQLSLSTTVVVDGVSEWKNPIVHVGDSIIFRHRNHYNLYVFQNREAFNLCNFTQATLLTKPNSTSYTWHPSRTGFFYFSFNNGSLEACQQAQKLAIKVQASAKPRDNWATSPALPPRAAPAPTSGGTPTSSPVYPWPFRPHEAAPSSAEPSASPPATVMPDKGAGIPFINSNPAVPLPTGEVDSATIRPVPTSGHGGLVQVKVVQFAAQMSVVCVVLVML